MAYALGVPTGQYMAVRGSAPVAPDLRRSLIRSMEDIRRDAVGGRLQTSEKHLGGD